MVLRDEDSEFLEGPTSTPLTLTAEQNQVLEYVKAGKNVFFTGCAGTGKSVLLRYIIEYLRRPPRNLNRAELVITAPTGLAAKHIGGETIHSWALALVVYSDCENLP